MESGFGLEDLEAKHDIKQQMGKTENYENETLNMQNKEMIGSAALF